MLKIAIAEDEASARTALKEYLDRWQAENGQPVQAVFFESGSQLLENIPQGLQLALLDIQMPGLSGMETAHRLRRTLPELEIVFITSYTHFVFDAFKVNAFRFLLKPVEEHKVYEALDGFFRIHGNDHLLRIKSDYETVCLNTKDIVYLEADNKRSWIHTTDRNIHVSKTMASVARQIPRNHFYKVNRAFIVNFNYICRYDQEKLTFKTGESVYISRNYLTAFKVAYRKYSEETQRV